MLSHDFFNNIQNSLCVLGDDAQEEEGENPFANLINNPENEKLYIDDPKKALKGYFEREGTWYFFYKKKRKYIKSTQETHFLSPESLR